MGGEDNPGGVTQRVAYFPNLNGLRFIAALSVIVMHVQQERLVSGMSSTYQYRPMQYLGPDGVLLFFVLSGFLITYLLLEEMAVTRTIEVKHFYIRRILRIWPLYYLAVFVGFVILPHFWTQPGVTPTYHTLAVYGATPVLLFLFFAPNVEFALYPGISYVTVLWSIGTEEQFYLTWPWLLRCFETTSSRSSSSSSVGSSRFAARTGSTPPLHTPSTPCTGSVTTGSSS